MTGFSKIAEYKTDIQKKKSITILHHSKNKSKNIFNILIAIAKKICKVPRNKLMTNVPALYAH